MEWGITKNIEYSIITALREQENIDQNGLTIRPEKVLDTNWHLPEVSIYYFAINPGRLEIGSNIRFDTYVIMVDIRSNDQIPPVDIADWVIKTLNNGCPYYEFSPNSADPDNPIQVVKGHLFVDVFTHLAVNLGDDVEIWDKYRHRLTLRIWVTN